MAKGKLIDLEEAEDTVKEQVKKQVKKGKVILVILPCFIISIASFYYYGLIGLLNAVVAIVAFLGFLGGIPAIKSFLEPKLELNVINAKAVSTKRGNFHDLYIKIKNNGEVDASGVTCPWVVIRRDTGGVVADSNARHTDVGQIPAHREKKVRLAMAKIPLEHPYTIIIKLKSDDKIVERKEIPLEILPESFDA